MSHESSNDLENLEKERDRLKREIDQLPDMRPGSLSIAHPRCGKPTCH